MRVFAALGVTVLALGACTSPGGGEILGQGPIMAVDLKGRAQRRNLSCESRSACDVLAHYGVDVDENAFLRRLPRSDNPDLGFVGDVDGPTGQLPPNGYGVHEEPVAATMRSFGVDATAHKGVSLDWLWDELFAERPVIVWATSTLRPGKPVTLHDRSGQSFQAVRGEHTFIVVGWHTVADRITLIDAATGKPKRVSSGHFDAAWASLGRRAVVVQSERTQESP